MFDNKWREFQIASFYFDSTAQQQQAEWKGK